MTSTKWRTPWIAIAALLSLALVTALQAGGPQIQATQAQAQQAPAQAAQFHVVRSVSGSKGAEVGNDFAMEDPRTVFKFPSDKQVIVFFEWDGPLGMHKFQGTWRSPDGKVVSVSNFQYEARETRFRGYWTLTLPEGVTPGLWALEAQIDGQPAGMHTFQIQVDESSLPPKPMAEADIYKRALGAMVFVESVDATGHRISRRSGFFVQPNLVLTAFENLDGATTVRVELPGGGRQTLTEVAAWNRAADWVLLRVNAPNVRELMNAKPGSWKIGDIDYLLDAPGEGGRTIQPVEITGVQNVVGNTQRIYVSWSGDIQSVGSPLLDAQGLVVGMLGAGPLAGMGNQAGQQLVMNGTGRLLEGRASQMVVPITEVALVPPLGSPVTLADMSARGLFVTPVIPNSEVQTGYVCETLHVDRSGEPVGTNIRQDFSRKQGTIAVVAMWRGVKDRKTTSELRIYDSENRKVVGATPKGFNLKRDQMIVSTWKISIAQFPAGIYRVDVLAGDQVQWREYILVTE